MFINGEKKETMGSGLYTIKKGTYIKGSYVLLEGDESIPSVDRTIPACRPEHIQRASQMHNEIIIARK